MMQHVATAQSKTAAFATDTRSNSSTNSEQNDQFGQLLQEQKSLHSLAGASESAHHTSRKAALQQSTEEASKVSSSAERKDTITPPRTTSNEKNKTHDAQSSGKSRDKTAMESAIEDGASDEGELDVGDTKTESANIVAEEWVSLVDNLQKLADITASKEQPEVLQDLSSQLQIVSQDDGTDIVDKKTLDTTIDNVIKKDLLLANQQIEMGEQADLNLAENKTLLTSLLVDSEQVQQADTPTKSGSVALQGELLEQGAKVVQTVPSNLSNLSETEKAVSNNDIKNILNLNDNKLDTVLESIAQQVIIPKATDGISSVESQSKDFVSALKVGLEEYKSQLAQGREPGIDLKTLVSDALAKTTETGVVKDPINLEQILKNVSQVLDFTQTMNRAIEHNHDQVYSAMSKDVAQIQGEQSKQIQLNQLDSKFEKAMNIAKPEGHEQLAEKVRWMVNTKNFVAEIRLDPAELGSMHVKVAVSGESATVNFVVQSQQARDAVDNATPRLREMLAEKGIELGQSSVRQESDGRQSQGNGESTKQGSRDSDDAEDIGVSEQVLAQQNIVNGALGGIDYFV